MSQTDENEIAAPEVSRKKDVKGSFIIQVTIALKIVANEKTTSVGYGLD